MNDESVTEDKFVTDKDDIVTSKGLNGVYRVGLFRKSATEFVVQTYQERDGKKGEWLGPFASEKLARDEAYRDLKWDPSMTGDPLGEEDQVPSEVVEQQRREARTREAVQVAQREGWPALVGSDKQVAWAESIRCGVLSHLEESMMHTGRFIKRDMRRGMSPEEKEASKREIYLLVRPIFEGQTNAAWWIEYIRHDLQGSPDTHFNGVAAAVSDALAQLSERLHMPALSRGLDAVGTAELMAAYEAHPHSRLVKRYGPFGVKEAEMENGKVVG